MDYSKHIVLGKEFILTSGKINSFLRAEFGYRVHVQDIWLDEKDIHIRIAGCAKRKVHSSLMDHGFKQVKTPHQYDARETADNRLERILQSINIIKYSW